MEALSRRSVNVMRTAFRAYNNYPANSPPMIGPGRSHRISLLILENLYFDSFYSIAQIPTQEQSP